MFPVTKIIECETNCSKSFPLNCLYNHNCYGFHLHSVEWVCCRIQNPSQSKFGWRNQHRGVIIINQEISHFHLSCKMPHIFQVLNPTMFDPELENLERLISTLWIPLISLKMNASTIANFVKQISRMLVN